MRNDQTTRRTLVIPPELFTEARRAAAAESAERGRTVSVSEWVRAAIAERLEREREQAA